MALAIRLARRGLGACWPNPSVGCVLVDPVGNLLLAAERTATGGRPHAEAAALAAAGPKAKGATAYVTLEPCAHYGQTPPCAEALVEAGIARCVVLERDPFEQVAGKGLTRLAQSGVDVAVCAPAEVEHFRASYLNAGFFSRIQKARPWITLKLATSLDGRIATATGESQWITGEAARAQGHLLRASHDGILVGSGTVLADDPALTCRLPGLEASSPVRIFWDGALQTPVTAQAVQDQSLAPVWILTETSREDTPAGQKLQGNKVELLGVEREGAHLSVAAALRALAERGMTRVLVEGGAGLAGALLEAGVVDRIAWFRAGVVLGDGGLPAVGTLSLQPLSEARRFRLTAKTRLGPDTLEIWDQPTGSGLKASIAEARANR